MFALKKTAEKRCLGSSTLHLHKGSHTVWGTVEKMSSFMELHMVHKRVCTI